MRGEGDAGAPRLAVGPGQGLVQRAGDVTIVILDPDRNPDTTRMLLEATRTGPDGLFAELGRIVTESPGTTSPFAVAVTATDDPGVFLHGAVGFAALAGGLDISARGEEGDSWMERSLPSPLRSVRIGLTADAAESDPWSDLREGVARGSWAAYLAPAPAPADPPAPPPPPPPPAPAAAPAPAVPPLAPPPVHGVPPLPPPVTPVPASAPPPVVAAPASAAAPGGPAGPRPGTVIVKGIRCPVDHHNSPAASYCSSCGRRLGISRSLVLVDGPRPPLGVLIVDDGSTVPVEVDLIIGRDPEHDALVREGRARAITIPDESQSVSRSHLLVVLEDWDVLIEDRGSSNGTFVWEEADQRWRRLGGTERLRIDTGTRLLLGRREVVFDQHHVR